MPFDETQIEQFTADIKDYLDKVKGSQKDAIADFMQKVEGLSDTIIDAVMLTAGTHPLEWDVEINNKYGLEGRMVLVPVMVPKSILISMDMKGYIAPDSDIDQDIKGIVSYIFTRGIAAVHADGKDIIPQHVSNTIGKMLRKKMQSDEDDD